MKVLFSIILLMVLPISSLASCSSIDSVKWLLGYWGQVDRELLVVSESWIPVEPIDGGVVRTFEGAGMIYSERDKNYGRESLRIVEMLGDVFYLARVPDGELPVPFKLVQCAQNRALFKNDQHDFPKVIEYVLSEEGTLEVFVNDGNNNGFSLKLKPVPKPEMENSLSNGEITSELESNEDLGSL